LTALLAAKNNNPITKETNSKLEEPCTLQKTNKTQTTCSSSVINDPDPLSNFFL